MTQQEALDILKTGVNVYLTGTAGSGKTHILDRYITHCKWRGLKVGITASTGIAATHLSGITINSWAGIGVKRELTDEAMSDLLKRPYLRKRFRNTDVLVIDEVSMLPSYTLENVDRILRKAKSNEAPFGGIQVILCGDFFQLPPIGRHAELVSASPRKEQGIPNQAMPAGRQVRDDPTGHFIYKSPLWDELDLSVCYLEKPYRQVDIRFLEMLSEIRTNSITKNTWLTLKERFFQSFPDRNPPTKLYTHNSLADMVNERELAKITYAPHIYHMEKSGNEILSDIMGKSCLAPEVLILKKGALVMFVKNNFDEGYVNGTLGEVVDFTETHQFPLVKTYDGRIVKAVPAVWEIEEEGRVQAKITQIPLRLAWAITIHKSQGMSLDAAEIDLGKSFVEGLGYVALSRVRSLEGIKLKSINRTALSVNEEVIQIDKTLKRKSEDTVAMLRKSYWYKKNQKSEY